ncbi:MAG: transporter substrate-binding domain-containing protein [Clostridia bacterium]|nr:transporter substrate-binding domain-containing protein [Clostridia bacterium]
MYCHNCGASAENDQKFCYHCGTLLRLSTAVEKPDVNTPKGNTCEPKETVGKKNKKAPVIIAVAAVVLAIVVAVLLFVLSSDKGKNSDSTEEATTGMAVETTSEITVEATEPEQIITDSVEDYTEPTTSNSEPTCTDYEYIKEKGTLVIGYTEIVPMNYHDSYGNFIGFDTEFAEAVCAELGVTPVLEAINWAEKENLLNSKEIDCIWNGMPITEERSVNMSVSVPYMINGYVLVVRAEDADKYTTAESFNGATVSAERESVAESVVYENDLFSGVSYTGGRSTYKVLEGLSNGVVDICVVEYDYYMREIRTGRSFEDLVMIDSLMFNEEEYGIAFRKGSDATAKVNEAMQKLAESGKLYEIAKKYNLEYNLLIGGKKYVETLTEGKLTVVTNAEFAPFEYVDESGEYAGIDIEIAEYIANELGLRLEIINVPFDSVTYSVYEGDADIGIAAITPTGERTELVDFTEPYYTYSISVLSMEDSYSIEGKTVGTLYDSSAYFYVSYELLGKDIVHVPYNDMSELREVFESGYLDYIVVPHAYEESFIYENENVHGYWVQDYDNYAICYSKENKQLQKEINAVLSQMIDNGKLDEIFEKYL